MKRETSDGLKKVALMVAFFLTTFVGLFFALNIEPRYGFVPALVAGVTIPVLLVFLSIAGSRVGGRFISYEDVDAVKAYIEKLEGKKE
jgi:hypothetical protein